MCSFVLSRPPRRCRRTAQWEAHVWVKMSAQGGKGHQRHLGSYSSAADAARVYNHAVLKLRGDAAETNYPRAEYVEVRAVCRVFVPEPCVV